ncbi:MAG: acyl-CoA synthetase FdrA [Firmicutes bacterium]|nr:acyl-CoA synthetase FdrA [Bacillota bacterium]
MEEKMVVRSNVYFDSVTLMSVSQRAQRLEGIDAVMIGMGTPLNLDLLGTLGFKTSVEAGPNDLIFALRGAGAQVIDAAMAQAEELLSKGLRKAAGDRGRGPARSLAQALERQPSSNLALISVPGAYAAREARKALEAGWHVMLFSDNVAVEEEVSLKRSAHQKGLLLMGPDCGTAIINGVPLAFANVVRKGAIGIVGASGTGTQEVCVQIDRLGQGVSQVIGTGGRDLSRAVGGIMMLDGIEALKQDSETKVIVVVSKPAAPEVAEKVHAALRWCGKPAVYCLIGAERRTGAGSGTGAGSRMGAGRETPEDSQVKSAGNLLEAARLAVEAAGGQFAETGDAPEVADTPGAGLPGASLPATVGEAVQEAIKGLKNGQRYLRGLFSGGTLGDEAMAILAPELGTIHSNVPLAAEGQLSDPARSFKHTVLDLGDDRFTAGRPHPMIDLSLRIARLLGEARDPEVAVILLDVVLGYGSHPDPASELVPAIRKAREIAAGEGRNLVFAAYVCGTDQDPQGYQAQVAAFRQVGVAVFPSNVEAAEFAGAVARARAMAMADGALAAGSAEGGD